jgi:aspartate kinase
MLDAHGFLARVFAVFDRHRTVVDAVTTSEVSVSVTIDDAAAIDAIEAELLPFAEVRRTPDVALLCAVGERLRIDGGLCPTILESLGGLPLHMVSQAASRQNLTLVVDERDLPTAMSRLHARFFPVPEPEHAVAGDTARAGARL